MASTTIIPVHWSQSPSDKTRLRPSNNYIMQDHGRGYQTYSYEFDLIGYEPEQITVMLDDYGTLRIRAFSPPCREFKREYNLGGPNVETKLIRNTVDSRGRLRVDIDVRPRRYDLQAINNNNNNNVLTYDLRGYKPENVTVRINHNGLLKISGKHIDNAFDNQINREFYTQYQLPSNIDPDQVRARMNQDQILTIELPQPSSRNYTNQGYWVPVYERNYPPYYGTAPHGGFCCCNIM